MTARHWVIVGLVAGLALFGGGYLFGYRAGTSTPESQLAWKVNTERLLGEARVEHRRIVDSLRRVTNAQGVTVAQAQEDAAAAESDEQAARRRGAALQDSLQVARARGDSAAMVRHLDSLVTARDAELVHVKRSREIWRGMFITQLAKAATLQRRVDVDSARLVELEAQLDAAPKVGNPAQGNRVVRAAETVAIGAVTARACEASVLSVGCLSGVAVTAARVW